MNADSLEVNDQMKKMGRFTGKNEPFTNFKWQTLGNRLPDILLLLF